MFTPQDVLNIFGQFFNITDERVKAIVETCKMRH